MIDDVEKAMDLMERMHAPLPIHAVASKELQKMLQEQAKRVFPRECRVTKVRYLGDEGGIVCKLDFGLSDITNALIVSITHLKFDRGNSLAREIEAYCKHRVKRLRKLRRGMGLT